jgi:hypothetical protein
MLCLCWYDTVPTIPLTLVSGRTFFGAGTSPTPPSTLSFFASFTASVAACHMVGGSGVHPRQEEEVDMGIRLHES